MDDEPKPTTSVEGYRNSYFVFTGYPLTVTVK